MQKIVFTVTVLALCLSACTSKNNISKGEQNSAVLNLPVISKIQERQERVITPDIYQYTPEAPEVVRYDRYLLVGSSPQEGQKYLLEQLVNVKISLKKKEKGKTIRQGLETTLANTGFTLCHTNQSEVSTLFSLPLPKIHYSFGAMKLREALQMIAGPAYDLTVNDISRTVCFKPRPVEKRVVIPTTEVTTTTTEVIETDVE